MRKRSSGKTALIADDNFAVRAALRDLFLSDGFASCIEADNGTRAIAAALVCKPDLIILDMAMPVMSGLQAALLLKELVPYIPIIIVSLHVDYLKGQNLASLGIAATFSKSESHDQILERAHELMGE